MQMRLADIITLSASPIFLNFRIKPLSQAYFKTPTFKQGATFATGDNYVDIL